MNTTPKEGTHKPCDFCHGTGTGGGGGEPCRKCNGTGYLDHTPDASTVEEMVSEKDDASEMDLKWFGELIHPDGNPVGSWREVAFEMREIARRLETEQVVLHATAIGIAKKWSGHEGVNYDTTSLKDLLLLISDAVDGLVGSQKTELTDARKTSDQKTTCGVCGNIRHTPWRDSTFGYVCLPCLGEPFSCGQEDAAILDWIDENDVELHYSRTGYIQSRGNVRATIAAERQKAKPTPPPGYRLLTDEEKTKPLPMDTLNYSPENGADWHPSGFAGSVLHPAYGNLVLATATAQLETQPETESK